MHLISIFVVISIMVLAGCSPDVPTITSFTDSWRLLPGGARGLSAVSMPTGETIDAEVWTGPLNAPYPIGSAEQFRDRIHLLHGSEPWVVRLDAATLAAVDTIDLGVSGSAADIAFANATTAYVSLPGARAVGVVDLTVGRLVRTIDVGGAPAGIAATGNQLCTVLPSTNEAVIIDSRTNTVEARIATGRAPRYVRADDLNGLFCIVTLGAGKIDDDVPTVPTIEFLSASTRQIIKTLDVSGRATNATAQRPRGLVVTNSEFAFVPVQNGLVRVNTRQRSRTIVMQPEAYDHIAYAPGRAELLTSRTREGASICDVFDEFGEALRSSVTLNDSVSALAGVGP
jgi:hypothetical protein